PEFGEDDVHHRIDDDGVRNGEEADRALAKDEGRHRDEGVRRVEITADEKPGDDGAKTPVRQAPLGQAAEIAAPPAPGQESDDGDRQEQDDEDGERYPLHLNASTSRRGR